MMTLISESHPEAHTTNLFINALPPEAMASLLPQLKYVALPLRTRCTVSDEAVEVVRFPLNGLVSFVAQFDDGSLHEVGVVGREGSVGAIEVLCGTPASFESLVQIAGSCLEIDAAAFADELRRNAGLRELLLRYVYAVQAARSQLAACNGVHSIEARSARWLLVAHDRVRGDTVNLTHEFLGEMLNVRRAGITEAAIALRDKGAISYRRGNITVLSRSILESISCECYKTSNDRMTQILGYDVRKRSPGIPYSPWSSDAQVASRRGASTG